MSFTRSPNLQFLEASQTVAISNEAKRRQAAGEDVIDLGVGEPDFDTPTAVAESGIAAIRAGHTRYAPNIGIAPLREAMAGALSRMSGGRAVDPARILVSNGSKQSLFNACFALFGPGDEVLIPSPAWVSYPQIVHLARATPVAVAGDPEWGLKVSVDDLERHRTPATRGLILCSPSNPTGAVYSAPEVRAIAEWAARHGIWLLSDEIYRRIHYGAGPAPSILDLEDGLLERTVVIYGASKAYAMTGWRIGAAYAPAPLHQAMAALQSHTTTGANHPAMHAAATAFSDPAVDAEVDRMVAAFRRRRDYLVARFTEQAPGVEFVEPHGAFYLFFRVEGVMGMRGAGGLAFCERVMQEEGLALVPGGAFGDDRWVRLSYSVSDADLERATDRLLACIGRLDG
ncbi:MAG: pyridoxal phosphate-dependent aminotransferase [Gemmatimonadetes bacterium]|nr:pyridoxal phosphate-dependent aminotransferase [Gemmatimonadota bacterium]MCB9504971.1 pyridoxal phosphate-dependent aminotransferase [Gemmatimonadales bacterium]MCA9763493.1 pyridoxal phosphate-dependent aminotransferase [Gemmatimonadota bacterium]MCA9768203.1 pyridoxal phosphate-dependent aminotransferase [Gemmatimonadota bacterium]HPF61280.1 pyridoxal phosphate-dependent aminotransferase [Gemmatimonadales bacterium]